MPKIIPVILSGGSGTRLWPLSRAQHPKQYLKLVDDKSMLQKTILRVNALENIEDIIIICNAKHRFLVAEQCKQINIKLPTILLEPVGKNTAPAIAAAALQSIKYADDAILLVLSADHVIEDMKAFHRTIYIASEQAQDGKLVTFGIIPTNANTGYGYIKLSKDIDCGAYNVEEFVEKPTLNNAKKYLKHGGYLWNSGMFMFQANIFIHELTNYSPNIVKATNNAIENASHQYNFIFLEKQSFELCPSDSIDYALMEKSTNVVTVPLDVQWNDVGSFSVLSEISKKDNNGNVILGDVVATEVTNTYINANNVLVAALGIKDLVIVQTSNAILVSTKDKAQEVNKIVNKLQQQKREEVLFNSKVYRPWGWYDSIEKGDYFQVKRLHINPGARLSLQKHKKRAEHWVVVSGTATVIKGEKNITLIEGDSTDIPVGVIHSLENKTTNKLEVIEIQSGSYLGEDDIVRFEDIYGRRVSE